MAYSDTRGLSRFNPASVGAALAINSLMLAGFVMLKPDILPGKHWKILEAYPVVPDRVKTPPVDRADNPPKGDTAFTPTPRNPALPQDETGFVLPKGDELGMLGGTGIELPIDPIDITQPVLKNARLDPRFASAVQPHYPPGLIRQEVEGSVTVRVLVGVDGRVKAIEPVKASHADFLAATRKQALGKWRFIPATRDGEAVESWREMTVTFVMPQ